MRYKNEDLESEVEDEEEDPGTKTKKKPPKKSKRKNRKKMQKKKPQKKKQKPCPAPVKKGVKADVLGASAYSPGAFKDARTVFIRSSMADKKVSYKDANQLWLKSGERAKMLEGMPMSELIRRRFVKPAKNEAKKA